MQQPKSTTRLYGIWKAIRQRCLNPNNKHFDRYGGRGIKVCDRWRNSFETFREDVSPRPEGYWLERIDNDGHYEPSNCRWATPKEQGNNRWNNRLHTRKGETLTISQWAARAGLRAGLVYARVHEGWHIDTALETPVQTQMRNTRYRHYPPSIVSHSGGSPSQATALESSPRYSPSSRYL